MRVVIVSLSGFGFCSIEMLDLFFVLAMPRLFFMPDLGDHRFQNMLTYKLEVC